MTPPSWDTIVLAGRRAGEDPFADAAGVAHRALVPVAGRPMLERVVATLRNHPSIGAVRISIDRPELLRDIPSLANWIDAGEVEVLRSGASPSGSALAALDATSDGTPTLLTTADHALLDARILDVFLEGAHDAHANENADLAVGLVHAHVLRAAYPESRRTYLRFADTAISGANLFGLYGARARRAVEFWSRLEQHRKRPWRLVAAFGPGTLLRFATRRLTLAQAFERASRAIGVSARPIALPFAEAAIDVDRPADLTLVESILAARVPTGDDVMRPKPGA